MNGPIEPLAPHPAALYLPHDPSAVVQIPSPNFSKGRKGATPRLIVVHSTESHERAGAARSVAQNWFALVKSGVSAQYLVDPAEVVQCVGDGDTAWHAGRVNPYSIGIELCGKASQTEEQWLDEDSRLTLARSAALVGYLCKVHSIDVRMLRDDELRACHTDPGVSGICGHVDVNRTHGSGSHYDPGPSFPWLEFMLAVRGYRELLG